MMEDKLPKIDTGQIKEETEGDGRDREREWNYKNNNHHITHTTNVSCHVINEITRLPFSLFPFLIAHLRLALIGFQLKIKFHYRSTVFPMR
jgi:hypothetical protein